MKKRSYGYCNFYNKELYRLDIERRECMGGTIKKGWCPHLVQNNEEYYRATGKRKNWSVSYD